MIRGLLARRVAWPPWAGKDGMDEKNDVALDVRRPDLWEGHTPERIWALYSAHLHRRLDATLPHGRVRAVVRVAEAPRPAMPAP